MRSMLKDERDSHKYRGSTGKCGHEETPQWGTIRFLLWGFGACD